MIPECFCRGEGGEWSSPALLRSSLTAERAVRALLKLAALLTCGILHSSIASMSIVPGQLQELLVDEEKASEIRSLLRSQGMEYLLGEPKNSSTDCMRLLFQYGADGLVSNLRSSSLILSKSEATCRYFTMPGGCVRGEKCLFSHPTAEFMSLEVGQSFIPKQVGGTKRIGAEDLRKKIFVGGLSPSVESDDLREFFEVNYGPVLDAVVIGSQAGDQMQSRGFGFVTFKHAESVSAAVEAHFINIYGKKVEIKGAVPRSEPPALEVSKADSGTTKDSGIGMAPAMAANKTLDLNEAEVLEVATPGSLCLPKNELLPCNDCSQTSPTAETQQTNSSQETHPCLIDLPSAGVSNVSSDSNSQSLIRETLSESASSSYGISSANVPNVSCNRSFSQFAIRGAPSYSVQGRKPTWLTTFKEWLPEFLTRVSLRLKDGEWYPLSSLKGDYRAICGLELDHVSIGFEKLSDFVRSFPELCRMKIVPVGRGPATHMVLLPPLTRNFPSAAGRRSLSNITTRSLVDGTRSYAEVACQGSGARLGRSDAVPPSPALCKLTSGSNLGHQGTHAAAPAPSGELISSVDLHPAFSYRLHHGLSSREKGPSSCTSVTGDNADLTGTSNGPSKTSFALTKGHSQSDLNNSTSMTSNSGSSSRCRSVSHDTLVRTYDAETLSIGDTSSSDINAELSKEDVTLLLELISRLKKTGTEHAPPPDHTATGFYHAPVTVHDAHSAPRSNAPPGQASQKTKNLDNERERSIYFPFVEQEPKSPTRDVNLPTTPFNHPFAGFLSENIPPSSMWGQNANRINVGGYGIPGRGIETFNPACQFYEDSSHDNESNYGTPSGYLSASSSPGSSKMAGVCEMCFERQALWVAVPCGHPNMCSVCKTRLSQGNQDTTQCFVCNRSVERWIALH